MRTWLNILLLGALAATLALNFALSRRPDRPNYRFLPEMVDSSAYGAFASNPNFADGTTLQTPPFGTIARGHMPLGYQATPEDAVRAGRELINPVSHSDAGTVSRGKQLFGNFCQPCHGPAGKGDGPVAQRGFPPPPSLSADHALGLADGQIFHILTYGQANMPSHASQISPADRWSLVAYVRSLQAPTKPQAQRLLRSASGSGLKTDSGPARAAKEAE